MIQCDRNVGRGQDAGKRQLVQVHGSIGDTQPQGRRPAVDRLGILVLVLVVVRK